MKGWKTLVTILMFALLTLTLPGCGGGGGDNGSGKKGDKPKVTTQAVDSLSVSGGTFHGLITSAESFTAEFEVDEDPNFGSPMTVNVPGTFAAGTNVAVSANWAGGLPGKTYYDRLKAINKFGTSVDNGVSFKTYAAADTLPADNVIDNNARLNGIVSSMEPVPVEFRWGNDPTITIYTVASAGTVSGLNQAVHAQIQTSAPGTWYFQAVVEPGTAREKKGAIYAFRNDGNITGSVGRFWRLRIFVNLKLVATFAGDGVNPVNFNLNTYTGDVQFTHAYNVGTAQEREYTVLDASDNNKFSLEPGGTLNVPFPTSFNDAGTTTIPITGTDYAPSVEIAGNINGAFSNDWWKITNSNAAPPAPQTGDNVAYTSNYVQNPATPNRVEISIPGFPTQPTIGTMNGGLLVYSAFSPIASGRYFEWMNLDNAGVLRGEITQSWVDSQARVITGIAEERR